VLNRVCTPADDPCMASRGGARTEADEQVAQLLRTAKDALG
jgi:hypothetical protein